MNPDPEVNNWKERKKKIITKNYRYIKNIKYIVLFQWLFPVSIKKKKKKKLNPFLGKPLFQNNTNKQHWFFKISWNNIRKFETSFFYAFTAAVLHMSDDIS